MEKSPCWCQNGPGRKSYLINLNLDLSSILDFSEGLKEKMDKALRTATQNLAMQAHAKILESVQSKLHSTREKYINALSFGQVDDSTWIINLDQSAMFIEEGVNPGSMLPGLLRSPKAKTSKEGHKYLVVPFQHNKNPGQQTQAGQDLTATIKAELKKRQIPFSKVERDEFGKAKTGRLHSFNIDDQPTKTHEGPGQGHGRIGQPRQGSTGIPFLRGISIYQHNVGGKIQKGIMTFRVASSAHPDKWVHPGLEGRAFLEEAEDWARAEWIKIASEILGNAF